MREFGWSYNQIVREYLRKGKTAMTTISENNDVVTTINTFMFEPENQQRGLELLVEIAKMIRKEVPGFLSANFHMSVDGTRVVNYAQYSSHEAFQVATAKVFEKADTSLLIELRQIATPDAHEYKVRTILEG
ncbi:antibiotic biosynthesis monooxygenase [Ktedonobacter robiniae]|uniref:Antibiotic biosynthesis monooxygenase n=2 Tax=Ktedonobacter robiniae TaxID=2778365 RepID=A0ABQ3UTR9_9CHLR|nr:antibiotic biosynthesis monooxygenase [Ktedonobacter robiniae]